MGDVVRGTGACRRRGRRLRRLPLVVYLAVYVSTCFVGATALLMSSTTVGLAQLFTGSVAFYLSPKAVFENVLLLTLAPILLAAGYEGALRVHGNRTAVADERSSRLRLFVFAPWVGSAAVALVSLARASAFARAGSWRSYREWVMARWHLFDTLSFLEFVNIYIILPVTTAIVVLWVIRRGGARLRRVALAALTTAPMIGVDVFLYQKKTLLVSMIVVALALFVYQGYLDKVMKLRTLRAIATLCVVLYALYCFLILRPSISTEAKPMSGQPGWLAERPSDSAGQPSAPCRPDISPVTRGATGQVLSGESSRARRFRLVTERMFPGRWIGIPEGSAQGLPGLSRGPALALYVLLGPVTRTPLPALAYPSIFPEKVPFYGLDVGFDFLGLGRMPTDNILVHRELWPLIQGGTVMVPFQYALFSQVGLGGALLLSVAVGYGLAFCWTRVSTPSRSMARAAGSALVLLAAIYVAGDSIRNSLLASYGVAWGALYLIVWSRLAGDRAPGADAAS